MQAQARSGVIGSAGLQGCRVEGINGGARCRVEGQMESRPRRRRTRPFFQRQKIASSRWSVAGGVAFRPNATEPERRERGIVERYRAVEIGGAEGKVAEHNDSFPEWRFMRRELVFIRRYQTQDVETRHAGYEQLAHPHSSPRHAFCPSRTQITEMASAIIGSSHQRPKKALAASPTSTALARDL
jgi:hypothetical protein